MSARPLICAFILALTASSAVWAQADSAKRADSTKADTTRRARKPADLGPLRTIEFDTDEGTWMNLDVSPDGRTIVFELLGDLYTVATDGGDATPLTSGRGWDRWPRFSPDGKSIAFASDRDGSENLWIMRASGDSARQVTRETTAAVQQPVWAPDGKYLMVRKNLGTQRTYYNAELWLVHRDGGSGIRLTETSRYGYPTDAAFSGDGRFVYFSTSSPGGTGGPRWQIIQLDRRTGEFSTLPTRGGVGARVSPDGAWLAYVRRADAVSELRLHDLRTGAERVVLAPVTLDQSENFVMKQGGYPTMAFAPDGRSIVLTVGGKIHRVRTADGADAVVPFRAKVRQEVAQPIAVASRTDSGDVRTHFVRWPTLSPDGKTLAFSALGKLYVMSVPNGTPRRLTTSTDREYSPAFSPDGKSIAYTTWSDANGGHLRVIAATGGASRALTTVPGRYANPTWSRDGARIAFISGTNPELRGMQPENDPYYRLYWVNVSGGAPQFVITTRTGAFPLRKYPIPTFGADGSRLFYVEDSPGDTPDAPGRSVLVSVRLDGTEKTRHLRLTSVDEVVPSPDGARVAVTRSENVWLVEMPPYATSVVDVSFEQPTVPVKRLSTDGAGYVAWQDSNTLTWAFTNRVYRRSLDREQPESTEVNLIVPRSTPKGSVAFTDARLVTMRGDEVIERGTIVVRDGRITEVGPNASVAVPPDAMRVSAQGKTIIPGFIDSHAHLFYNAYELFPQQKWQMLANLAYGVTTSYDPSAHSIDVFPQAEMVETGDLVGPRIYSSGDVIYGTMIFPSMYANIQSVDDARAIVRKYKRYGALMIKQYLQPTRIQRQYLAQAAREQGVRITAEGGADMYLDLSMVADGYTAFEHSLAVAPLYRDVIELVARTGTHYTPTLLVAYGGPTAEEFFYAADNHHDDPKLRRFVPEDVLDGHRRRVVIPQDEYHFARVAAAAAAIGKAGGKVTLGAHGQLQGLGAHWELWALQMGGMSNLEAIRAATSTGAVKLGLERDLGTLEAGKAADFLVLNANPLDDIRNTAKIQHVVARGFVYDAESMTRVWPDTRPLARFFWMTEAEAKRYAPPAASALGGAADRQVAPASQPARPRQ